MPLPTAEATPGGPSAAGDPRVEPEDDGGAGAGAARASRVFTNPARGPAERRAFLEAQHRRWGRAFASVAGVERYLRQTFMPRSGRWVFLSNAKAATTSTMHALFHLEFGVPLTTALSGAGTMAAGGAIHRSRASRLFRCPIDEPAVADAGAAFRAALTVTTVRDPGRRALSGFRYLCRSDAEGAPQFVEERNRLCALTGFDWERHPGTRDGFVRFLDFIAQEMAHDDAFPVNVHWRPQVRTIRPRVFKPDLIGRVEDMPGFLAALAERLDAPLPEALTAPRNRQEGAAPEAMLRDADVRRGLRRCFALDYETFGYAP